MKVLIVVLKLYPSVKIYRKCPANFHIVLVIVVVSYYCMGHSVVLLDGEEQVCLNNHTMNGVEYCKDVHDMVGLGWLRAPHYIHSHLSWWWDNFPIQFLVILKNFPCHEPIAHSQTPCFHPELGRRYYYIPSSIIILKTTFASHLHFDDDHHIITYMHLLLIM